MFTLCLLIVFLGLDPGVLVSLSVSPSTTISCKPSLVQTQLSSHIGACCSQNASILAGPPSQYMLGCWQRYTFLLKGSGDARLELVASKGLSSYNTHVWACRSNRHMTPLKSSMPVKQRVSVSNYRGISILFKSTLKVAEQDMSLGV